MPEEAEKKSGPAPKVEPGRKVEASLSLWFVEAGSGVGEVKLRTDRTVKETVAETAAALKKRYQNQQRSSTEVRAGRIGK